VSGFKAILFDCDGVVLDSEGMGCGSLGMAVTEAGRPMSLHEARDTFSGNSANDTRSWMAAEGFDADSLFKRADEILFEMFERDVPLMPGIEHVLRDFSLKKAICSNSSIKRLDLSVARTSVAAFFAGYIYSAEHVAEAKPAPDIALHACAALGVLPGEAIFIDANVAGIACARAAGCLAVGFIGHSDDRENHDRTLLAAGADHVVYGMGEFHALLRTLTSDKREVA